MLRGLIYFVEAVGRFFETAERLTAVAAGLILAALFCAMPFTDLGADEPWYFWVGSGLIALAASALLAWVLFPPIASGRVAETVDQHPERVEAVAADDHSSP